MGRKQRRRGTRAVPQQHARMRRRSRPSWMSEELFLIGSRDNWMCWICGEEVERTPEGSSRSYATKDHLIPLSLGGPSSLWNYRIAHHCCNDSRDSQVPPPASVLLLYVSAGSYGLLLERYRKAYGKELAVAEEASQARTA